MQDLQTQKIEGPQFGCSSITLKLYDLNQTLSEIYNNLFAYTTLRFNKMLLRSNQLEIGRIKSFLKLLPNWDSYDALPISPVSADKAIEFIEEVDKYDINVYLTSPGPNSEILVLLKLDKREIECIFYPDKSKYVLYENDRFQRQGELKNNIIPKTIEWLRNR